MLHAPPPSRTGVLLMAAGFQAPVCENIRVLDGVFIAVRRHVWETQRFDAERTTASISTISISRGARAARARRLAVPLDLIAPPSLDGPLRCGMAALRRGGSSRGTGLDPLAPPVPGGLQARLETSEQVDVLRAALLHFRFGATVAT